MDGEHHGHPIIETSSATPSFDTYIAKDLAQAVFDGNEARRQEIADFLVKVGLNVSQYEGKVRTLVGELRARKQEEERVLAENEAKKQAREKKKKTGKQTAQGQTQGRGRAVVKSRK